MTRTRHPYPKTTLGQQVFAAYHTSKLQRYKPKLICIGCGCTDDRACPGGCSWAQPGICSQCVERADELLCGSKIAAQLFPAAFVAFRSAKKSGFSIASLVIVGFVGSPQWADRHRQHLAAGLHLKPFARVRFGRRTWSFDLSYRGRSSSGTTTQTYCYRLSYATGVKADQ